MLEIGEMKNPYQPPDVDRCRYEKPCMARYRLVFRIGISITIVSCIILAIAVSFLDRLPKVETELLIMMLSNVPIVSASLALSGWILMRWHRHDVEE